MIKKVYFPELYLEKNDSVLDRISKVGSLRVEFTRHDMIGLSRLKLDNGEIWEFLDGLKLRGRSGNILTFKKITTPSIAQLLGFVITDGSLMSTEGRVKLCQKEESLIRKYITIINDAYETDIKSSFNGKEVNIGSIPLRYILHKYYGIPLGKKVRIVEVPEQILESEERDVLRRFIAGLFDGDGYIQYYYLKKGILDHANFCISTASHKLMKQSSSVLKKLGIMCTLIERKEDGRLTLSTSGFKNSLKFYEQIIPFVFS